MKITPIFSLLSLFVCFSCDSTHTADSIEAENKRKVDSINRTQYLAHSDSIQKMYTSITIPHSWTKVQLENKKTTIQKSEDTLFVYKRIHIDISTGPMVGLICFPENGKSEVFYIKRVYDNVDSILFHTTRNITNETIQWVFKYANKEKSIGQWSVYYPDKKMFVVTGKYTSKKDE